MKILKIDTINGANCWSSDRKKLIVVHLDLEADLSKFNAKISLFYGGLNKILPLIDRNHYCLQHQNEFCLQISLVKTIIKIALELQNLAEMAVNFGCASTTTTGIEQIVLEYQTPKAGYYAALTAIKICQSLIECGNYPQIELAEDLQNLRVIKLAVIPDPWMMALLKEAESRQIPWFELSVSSLIQLGYGKYQRRLSSSLGDFNNLLSGELARDKLITQTLLRKMGFLVPNSQVLSCFNKNDLKTAIEQVGGYPIAVKPFNSDSGAGITLNINNWEDAKAACDLARQKSKSGQILVEKYYFGLNYRILVINGQVVAAIETMAAHIIGNGKSTIAQLVQQANEYLLNHNDAHKRLNQIEIDDDTEKVLLQQGYFSQSVPEVGEMVYLKATVKSNNGGITFDCTDKIDSENVWLAQRAAKIIGLEFAEIDLVCLDISRPLRYGEGAIIGVNPVPDLALYLQPDFGKPRNVAASILDWLYPLHTPTRIPVIAVTGDRGKSTVVNLMAHIFQQVKRVVGYTSDNKIYVGNYEVKSFNQNEFESNRLILQEPEVEVAVLRVTESQICETGLSFDYCDVGVILNLSDTDTDTDTDIAKNLSYKIVAKVVKNEGYVVLNADEPGIEAIAETVGSNVVYFSLSLQNRLIQKHILRGGLAAVYHNGYLSLYQDKRIIPIEQVINLPLITKRPVSLALSLVLAASLVAYLQGVSIADISTALRTFEVPRKLDYKLNYGDANLINLGRLHILLTCPDNLTTTTCEFILNWQQGERIGVIGAKSDRSNLELIELGKLSARIFDRLIVKEDDEQGFRERGEVAELISRGIEQQSNLNYELILDEVVAIQATLSLATTGSLIVILSEKVCQAISLLQQPSFPIKTSFL